jgi:uncharacterized OsmC-like protein
MHEKHDFVAYCLMVTMDIAYQGTLRTQATHGPSGITLFTDPPVDNRGRGESFSPTDLLATALGTCMMTYIGIAAETHGINVDGATMRVEKHMVADPHRRIGRLVVDVVVPGPLSERDYQVLLAAMQGCPVKRSLHVDIDITTRIGHSTNH